MPPDTLIRRLDVIAATSRGCDPSRMVSGLINIALGAIGIYLGLSGRVLAFTGSSTALIALSAGAVGLGVWQIWRDRRRGLP